MSESDTSGRSAPSPAPAGRGPGRPIAFHVLLGTDYAGKSSVLGELARLAPRWRIVSADDGFLGPRHTLIGRLRRALVGDVVPGMEDAYSRDFLIATFQTAVLHLRDEILRGAPGTPVVVDSYFYKILAKCRLVAASEHPLYDWWRTFPAPRRVFELEVDPATAWERCGAGRDLNPLEHYGTGADRLSFESFQRDLRKTMREETRALPVTTIGEGSPAAAVAREIQEAISHDHLG
ncbi:hypothetical protein [Streptomyces sp. NPDC047000]|uniref:hypothetical protein n=1 Tax=Streptomyces sp. NPDC047000 TaxID=3155474 RepID=UPI0033C9F7B7